MFHVEQNHAFAVIIFLVYLGVIFSQGSFCSPQTAHPLSLRDIFLAGDGTPLVTP